MNKKTTQSNTKHSRDIYISLWLSIIVCIIIIIFLFIPQAQTLAGASQQLLQSEEQTAMIEASYYRKVQSAQNLVQLQDGSILEESLLQKDNVISFIQVFESAAFDCNVAQKVDLQSRQQIVTGDVISVPTKIQVVGEWQGIIKFISKIEQADFYINPTLLEIAPYLAEDGMYELTIQTLTFWTE